MAISVEYLAIFRRTDTFCDSVASFTRLLQVDSSIALNNGAIRFQGQPMCGFQLSGGDVAAKNQRFFQLRFTWEGDPVTEADGLDRFISLLKAVRSVVAQADGEVETLWDDVSGHYARQAYPLIHDIENLMRRLIANFMLVNVGLEWAAETLPSVVEEAVRKSKRKDAGDAAEAKSKARDYLNVLHTLDFIHLGDILFNQYSKKTTQELYARLKDVKTPEEAAALKDFIPQSNWSRYFQKLVECESSYLETRWKKLYDLRCKVAHNAPMTGRDFEETRKLIDEVRPKLQDAVNKLSNVTVPPEDAEMVAENAARSINAAVGEYIGCWQQFEAAIDRRVIAAGGRRRPGILPPGELRRLGIVTDGQLHTYDRLRRLRNQVVHGPASDVPVEVIQGASAELRHLMEVVDCGDMVERLRRMPEQQREEEIEQLADNASDQILNSEEFGSAIAVTNATGYSVDAINVRGIDLSNGTCVVRLSYSASGDHDKEKVYCGSRVTGTAELLIEPDGDVSYQNITAEVDGEMDEPDGGLGADGPEGPDGE